MNKLIETDWTKEPIGTVGMQRDSCVSGDKFKLMAVDELSVAFRLIDTPGVWSWTVRSPKGYLPANQDERICMLKLVESTTRKVPCGPEHFPPGTVMNAATWSPKTYASVLVATTRGVNMLIGCNSSPSFIEYEKMIPNASLSHLQRSIDGGKTWLPCYVEVTEDDDE